MLLRALGMGLLVGCTPVSGQRGHGRSPDADSASDGAVSVYSRSGGGPSRPEDARPCDRTVEDVVVRQRQVSICQSGDPTDAWMEIDGVDVPLHYHPDFAGWAAVNHFGWFPDLEQLADSVLVSNPRLRFPKGAPAETEGGR